MDRGSPFLSLCVPLLRVILYRHTRHKCALVLVYMLLTFSCRRSHYDGIDDDVPNAWSLHCAVCDIIPSTPTIANPSTAVAPEPTFRSSTRSQTRRLQEMGPPPPPPTPSAPVAPRPVCHGGSFVDLELILTGCMARRGWLIESPVRVPLHPRHILERHSMR